MDQALQALIDSGCTFQMMSGIGGGYWMRVTWRHLDVDYFAPTWNDLAECLSDVEATLQRNGFRRR